MGLSCPAGAIPMVYEEGGESEESAKREHSGYKQNPEKNLMFRFSSGFL